MVVFHEEAQLGESSAHSAGLGATFAQTSNMKMGVGSASMQVPEAPSRSVPDVVMAPADLGPSESEDALARDLLASGWCRIVEELPDD